MRAASVRATWATGALFVTLGVRVYVIAIGLLPSMSAETAFSLTAAGALAEKAMLVVTAVLFLRWLALVVTLSRATSTTPLRWTASAAVWSFFIPLVSLYRPYHVLRDVHNLLAPEGVPEPAPRPRLDGSGGYRNVPMEKAPPPRTLPHASIGAWWGLFVAERMLGGFGLGAQVLAIGAALLAVLVVRSVEARLEERHRRLRYASDEELSAWGLAV